MIYNARERYLRALGLTAAWCARVLLLAIDRWWEGCWRNRERSY